MFSTYSLTVYRKTLVTSGYNLTDIVFLSLLPCITMNINTFIRQVSRGSSFDQLDEKQQSMRVIITMNHAACSLIAFQFSLCAQFSCRYSSELRSYAGFNYGGQGQSCDMHAKRDLCMYTYARLSTQAHNETYMARDT